MSRYEERTYRVGKKRPNIAEMKNQRERLKQDLEQFSARKPGAVIITSLRERIKALDVEIAEAEADKKREREQRPGYGGPDDDGGDRPAVRQQVSTRFPPRGRPGGGGGA